METLVPRFVAPGSRRSFATDGAMSAILLVHPMDQERIALIAPSVAQEPLEPVPTNGVRERLHRRATIYILCICSLNRRSMTMSIAFTQKIHCESKGLRDHGARS